MKLNDIHRSAGVSRETGERLEAFTKLLLRWNRRINLISRANEDTLWDRHIQDCLQLVQFVPADAKTAIDLGSGAGFPGLILAIATGCHFHLVESDERKAVFLREASRYVNAPTTIHAARAENLRLDPVGLVTARALAALPQLLVLAEPLLAPNGACLLLKGQSVDLELTDAARQWQMQVERWPSLTDTRASILKISGLRRIGSPP